MKLFLSQNGNTNERNTMATNYHPGFYGYDIYIPESVWDTAKEWDAQLKATGLEDRYNYTELEEPDRYVKGYVGELSVCNALALFNKRYVHKSLKASWRDRNWRDIIVWGTSGRTIALNVKTAGGAKLRHMRAPAKQVKRYRPDIYVAGQILGHHWFGLHGWIWHHEFVKLGERVEEKCPTVRRPFELLRHIDELLNNIQNL